MQKLSFLRPYLSRFTGTTVQGGRPLNDFLCVSRRPRAVSWPLIRYANMDLSSMTSFPESSRIIRDLPRSSFSPRSLRLLGDSRESVRHTKSMRGRTKSFALRPGGQSGAAGAVWFLQPDGWRGGVSSGACGGPVARSRPGLALVGDDISPCSMQWGRVGAWAGCGGRRRPLCRVWRPRRGGP